MSAIRALTQPEQSSPFPEGLDVLDFSSDIDPFIEIYKRPNGGLIYFNLYGRDLELLSKAWNDTPFRQVAWNKTTNEFVIFPTDCSGELNIVWPEFDSVRNCHFNNLIVAAPVQLLNCIPVEKVQVTYQIEDLRLFIKIPESITIQS